MAYGDEDIYDPLFRLGMGVAFLVWFFIAVATLKGAAGGDVNLDGAFTYADIGQAALIAYAAPGTWVLTNVPSLAAFLEYQWFQGITWQPAVVATVCWIVLVIGIGMLALQFFTQIVGRPKS